MSGQPASEASAMGAGETLVEMAIVPRMRDLGGGFEVRRVLPTARRRMVGPFIFLDEMGPTVFTAGQGLDVRPHPHIGLATVTYLFDGEILHRDSLGNVQPIRPGEVNWMVAGRGIAHSERTDAALRRERSSIFGIQSWVALPARDEETEPSFAHHGSDTLPQIEGEGNRIRLIAGSLYGAKSPVRTFSDLFYADAALAPGARLALPAEHEERALFLVEGAIGHNGQSYAPGQLLVFRPGGDVVIEAPAGARLMLLGGAPLEGQRHIWWNFVSSSKDRIEAAKHDWKSGRFAPVIGETERIPLPE
ncbi:MAG TPA: pirin family protein [Stellaceae bacterium]|nr:pirin family protein [Stellaceae bacterium]